MKTTAIKTHRIVYGKESLSDILDKYLTSFQEKTILIITSKIVSICEGNVIKINKVKKNYLIKQEAQYFIPPQKNKYNVTISVKRNLLVATAGIDESNGNGYYILWPKNPQRTANEVRKYLLKRFSLKKVGVIITDSRTSPLRWGITGLAISHSGFSALNDYIGKPDIFGRIFRFEKVNIADCLASAAVVTMGEGNEQTPLAVIEDVPFVKFQYRNPTSKELNEIKIKLEDDIYYPLLKNVKWEKGKGK